MTAPRQAILLAAGIGSRLGALTADRPKPLVPVGGVPILARALRACAGAGLARAVIATGYRHEAVERFCGRSFHGLAIEYVHNPEYATTNNVTTVARVAEALAGGGILLEGDVVFAPRLLERLLAAAAGGASLWAASAWEPWMDGCRLHAATGGRIDALEIVRGRGESGGWKSTGMLHLAPAAGAALGRAAAAACAAGRTDVYYDLVLRDLLAEVPIAVLDAGGDPWCEIDDAADLARAEALRLPVWGEP